MAKATPNLITEVFRQPLVECLSMVPSFLAELVQSNLITFDQNVKVAQVLATSGQREAVLFLLHLIHQSPRLNAVSQFVCALKKSGDVTNEQLGDLIQKGKNLPDFHREHRLIKKYYNRLQDVNPQDVLPHLTCIDPNDQQCIILKCQIGHILLARSIMLHLLVRTREPGWFEMLLRALEENGHGTLAGCLRSDLEAEEAPVDEDVQGMLSGPLKPQDRLLSRSLECMSLDDSAEQEIPHQDNQKLQGDMLQQSGEWPSGSQPQTMGPPTCDIAPGVRSRSSSSRQRLRQSTSRKSTSSQSPRRAKKVVPFPKRKSSRSREKGQTYNQMVIQPIVQHIYNTTTNNTVNFSNSDNAHIMLGGESNTMNVKAQRRSASPMQGCTMRQPGKRPASEAEDQPDHAKMSREEGVSDVHASPSENGYTGHHQRKRQAGEAEDQPDHAKMLREEGVSDVYASPSENGYTGHHKKKDDESWTANRPVLFEDQLELAEDAVNGMNTVLVAPTGSGKTHVAAYIIHNHFITDRPEHVEKRALFLVTTVNLVGQQEDKLKELLQPVGFFSVIGIHGASELCLAEELAHRNVIVLTAQLLENALNDIPLEQFSLLVFDECHLCQKGHAYNTIMAHYLEEKVKGNPKLPQIVGMTASLGTNKAKDQTDANYHAVQICANMDAHCISMIVRNKHILEERVNIPKEVEPIEVKCREHDPFADKINEIMGKIETMLKTFPNFEVQELVNSGTLPMQRGSQAYRQWCDRIKRNAKVFIENGQEVLYRTVRTSIDNLMEYNVALLINKQVRTVDAFNHLAQMMDKMNDRRTCFDENDRKLWDLYVNEERILEEIKDDPGNENPLLEKLCEIILEEYRVRPHSRAILFVKTIDTTEALHDWISETRELMFLKPGRIAGSRDMNSVQQNRVIEQFRNGEHKMLVATNLLEQGTDVPACNLVIRLDYVPSDFGHVQIKGRTRAKGGRSYLITLIDSKSAARDKANRQREVMMTEAAEYIKQKPRGEFADSVKRRQESNRIERQSRQDQKREIRDHNQDAIFAFCCNNCTQIACYSNDIMVYKDSQFMILDPEFSSRVKIREHPKPTRLTAHMTVIGKMFCKTCGHDWGALTRVQNMYFPSIKICRFSLKNMATSEADTFKKWKDAPFKPEPVSELPVEAKITVPTEILRKLRKL